MSHKFLLPRFYQEVLNKKEEMHKHVDSYYKIDSHPATQFLAKMIDERKPFITEAVRSVILRYLKREEF